MCRRVFGTPAQIIQERGLYMFKVRSNFSSDHTSGIKSLLLTLSLMGLGFAVASVIFFDNITDVISYAPIVLAISYLCFRLARLAKRVDVDDIFLYVSDNETEIAIPISEIVQARQTVIMRLMHDHVMIILDSPSEFGQKIIFFPKKRFPDLSEPHPIVDELNRLVHSHKQKMRENSTEE